MLQVYYAIRYIYNTLYIIKKKLWKRKKENSSKISQNERYKSLSLVETIYIVTCKSSQSGWLSQIFFQMKKLNKILLISYIWACYVKEHYKTDNQRYLFFTHSFEKTVCSKVPSLCLKKKKKINNACFG